MGSYPGGPGVGGKCKGSVPLPDLKVTGPCRVSCYRRPASTPARVLRSWTWGMPCVSQHGPPGLGHAVASKGTGRDAACHRGSLRRRPSTVHGNGEQGMPKQCQNKRQTRGQCNDTGPKGS
eukprot:353538-Chlamydomonas_euryale.AAC.2